MKNCVRCKHKVSRGDRHALTACPPPKGSNGWRRRAKARQRRKRQVDAAAVPTRGVAVAGIHKKRGQAKT